MGSRTNNESEVVHSRTSITRPMAPDPEPQRATRPRFLNTLTLPDNPVDSTRSGVTRTSCGRRWLPKGSTEAQLPSTCHLREDR